MLTSSTLLLYQSEGQRETIGQSEVQPLVQPILQFQHTKHESRATPKLRYAFGMEIAIDKTYIRPNKKDLPKKAEISQLAERFGLFAELQATNQMSLNFGLGATVPFYNRLRESGYNKTYMLMKDHVTPFVRLTMKYSIR